MASRFELMARSSNTARPCAGSQAIATHGRAGQHRRLPNLVFDLGIGHAGTHSLAEPPRTCSNATRNHEGRLFPRPRPDASRRRCTRKACVRAQKLRERRITAAWSSKVETPSPVESRTLPSRRTRLRSERGRPSPRRRSSGTNSRSGVRSTSEVAAVVAGMKDFVKRVLAAAKHLRDDIYAVRANAATRSFAWP